MRTSNLRVTSMCNMQTCTTGDLHGVLPGVALLEVEAIQIRSQVICSARVEVPVAVVGVVGVDIIGVARTRLLWLEGVVEAVVAAQSVVTRFATDLADETRPATASIAATSVAFSASTASAMATTTLRLSTSVVASMATTVATTVASVPLASVSSIG